MRLNFYLYVIPMIAAVFRTTRNKFHLNSAKRIISPHSFSEYQFVYRSRLPSCNFCSKPEITDEAIKRKEKKTKLNKLNRENNKIIAELAKCAKDRNYEKAFTTIENHDIDNFSNKQGLGSILLSVCYKKEHLPKALEIFNWMKRHQLKMIESSYLSLIRCYSDAEQVDECLNLINEMINIDIVPRLRTLQPILELSCKYAREDQVIKVLKILQEGEIPPTTGQLATLLEMFGKNPDMLLKPAAKENLDRVLDISSQELLGMSSEDILKVITAMNKMSPEDVTDQGILVDGIEDIAGSIISTENLENGNSVIAMNATFPSSHLTFSSVVSTPYHDPSYPVGHDLNNTLLTAEKYVTLKGGSRPGLRARVVDVSGRTCECPNCGGALVPLVMGEEERRQVREAILMNLSKTQREKLEAFGDWLRQQPHEFEYIVDASNVAYFNQNFESGRYSYKQIELVVEKLKEWSDKILIILPQCYAQKVIPNRIAHKKGKRVSVTNQGDRDIVRKFNKEGMLYVVPDGAYDDLYWIYATVYEGRSSMGYVVTNDLMRDHRLTVMGAKSFVRWRTSQIVYFGMSKAVVEESEILSQNSTNSNSTSNSNSTLISNTTTVNTKSEDNKDNKSTYLNSTSARVGDENNAEVDFNSSAVEDYSDPEIYLYKPGNFSREMQFSAQTQRWHIPCTDRSVWLCLNVSPTDKMTPRTTRKIKN